MLPARTRWLPVLRPLGELCPAPTHTTGVAGAPKKPCPKCRANVAPMPLRVEHLRHLGWQPYTVQSYQSWCGHTQEVLFVEVMGEARELLNHVIRPLQE